MGLIWRSRFDSFVVAPRVADAGTVSNHTKFHIFYVLCVL